MLHDRAKIYIKSGDGGRGVVSFRREKYVPFGGPDGGDGGAGGSVYLNVNDQMATLMSFRHKVHFRAEDGVAGRGKNMHGRHGADLFIPVPPGTVAYDDETGELIADLVDTNAPVLIARGGQGGAGNTRFKSSTNQAPRIAEIGEPGAERWLRLELKMIADVGLVGFPNAGKSTLLAAASAARPKIADYPFTTLEPNLGAVNVGGRGGASFILADIPGLIEGASGGAGLGLEFLRHIERCRMLLYVIDGSGGYESRDPVSDYRQIRSELLSYSEALAERPSITVINKIDLQETRDYIELLVEELLPISNEVMIVSAATTEGVDELMARVAERLQQIPALERSFEETEPRIYTLESDDDEFWEAERLSAQHFEVRGAKIERTIKMTDFELEQAVERLQRILESSGISAKLVELGIKPGHSVSIGEIELIWEQALLDAEAEQAANRKRRLTRRERTQRRLEATIDVPE